MSNFKNSIFYQKLKLTAMTTAFLIYVAIVLVLIGVANHNNRFKKIE